MSTDERIAMLQALLARVKSRMRPGAEPPPFAHFDELAFAGPTGSLDDAPADLAPSPPPPRVDRPAFLPPSSPPSGHPPTNGHSALFDDDFFGPPSASPLSIATPMASFRPGPVPGPPPSTPSAAPPKIGQRPSAPALSFSARGSAPPSTPSLDDALDPSRDSSSDHSWADLAAVPRPPMPPPSLSGVRTLGPPWGAPPAAPFPVDGASEPRQAPSDDTRVAPPAEPPPMEVVELDLDPDPGGGTTAVPPDDDRLESRSRLVSAMPAAPGVRVDDDDDELAAGDLPRPPSDPTIEMAAAEVSRAEMDAIEESMEEEDRAPSSSRRPISMEAKMSESEDHLPLHEPPPASGKLPAASPAIDLALDLSEPSSELEDPEPPAASRAAPLLAREPIHAEPVARGPQVALFVGRPPEDKRPRTFGELLDATLSL